MTGEFLPRVGILSEEHRRKLHRAADDAICYMVVPGPVAAAGVLGSTTTEILIDRGVLHEKTRPRGGRDIGGRVARCIAYEPQDVPEPSPEEGVAERAFKDRPALLRPRRTQ